MTQARLTLEADQIYGMTMYPGYGGGPYRTPIQILSLKPLGQRTYELFFLNIFYAVGVQGMSYRLRTLKREADYIAAEVGPQDVSDRMVVIERMTKGWIRDNAPELSNQLDELFDADERPIAKSFRRLLQ